jgi:hypothetical protein
MLLRLESVLGRCGKPEPKEFMNIKTRIKELAAKSDAVREFARVSGRLVEFMRETDPWGVNEVRIREDYLPQSRLKKPAKETVDDMIRNGRPAKSIRQEAAERLAHLKKIGWKF